jgi:hypothetical protein
VIWSRGVSPGKNYVQKGTGAGRLKVWPGNTSEKVLELKKVLFYRWGNRRCHFIETATEPRKKMISLHLSRLRAKELSEERCCWVPVAHAYNPSYSGGKDQEDHRLKSA